MRLAACVSWKRAPGKRSPARLVWMRARTIWLESWHKLLSEEDFCDFVEMEFVSTWRYSRKGAALCSCTPRLSGSTSAVNGARESGVRAVVS